MDAERFLFFIALSLASAGQLLANPVLLIHGNARGQGLARSQGSTCQILAADGWPPAAKELHVIGARGGRGKARFERAIELDGAALFQFTVTAGSAEVCLDDELDQLHAITETTLVLRTETGGLELIPIVTLYESDRVIGLASQGEIGQLSDPMRGALVMEQGQHKGLLTTIDSESEGRLARASSIDALVEKLGSWVRLPAPLADIERALEVLGRASEAKPTGDVGQVAAVEKLVRQGAELSGMDLSGLDFAGASLAKASLLEAALIGVSFERTVLQGADLSEARLDFAELSKARFEGSRMVRSRAYFANADGAVFDDLKGASSNWMAASARGASFQRADLRGASFKFADLTDADFTGATLTETLFIGAILDGATFTGATLSNTDLTSAYGSAAMFTSEQQGKLCATRFSQQGDGYVELTRVVPSTRFDSGQDYQQIASGRFDYVLNGLSRLDPCEERQHRPGWQPPIYTLTGPELIRARYDLQYAAGLLDVGGRREKFIARFRDQLKRLDEAVDRGRIIEVPGEVRQAITKELESNLNGTSPLVAELPFGGESMHLLALRRVPGYADSVNWAAWARKHYQDELERAWGGEAPSIWPRFFPQDFSPEQLSPEHVELYRRWTLARAEQVPELFRLSVTSPSYIESSSTYWAEEYSPRPPPSLAVVPLSEFHVPELPHSLLDRLGGESHGFLSGHERPFTDIAVLLEHPLERYRLDLPREFARGLGREPEKVELRLRIEDLEVIVIEGREELFNETYLVLRCDLVGMRLVAENGDAYPEELPSRGSHPLSTLRPSGSVAAED